MGSTAKMSSDIQKNMEPKRLPHPRKSRVSVMSKRDKIDTAEVLKEQKEQEDRLKRVLKEMKEEQKQKQKKQQEKDAFKKAAGQSKKDHDEHASSSSMSISKQLEFHELTVLNPKFMKSISVIIAVVNFLAAFHIIWLAVYEEAKVDHLLLLHTWTCPESHDGGDIFIRIILVFWATSSVALLWAEDENTAGLCGFWIVAKAFQITSYALLSNIERRGHAGVPALSLLLGSINLVLDLLSFAFIILFYFHLVGHSPVKDRKRQARTHSQINSEIQFASSQTFFQRKMAVEWICKQQALRCVRRLQYIRKNVSIDTPIKFEPGSFQVRMDAGFVKFMAKTHVTRFKYFETLKGKELLERLAKYKFSGDQNVMEEAGKESQEAREEKSGTNVTEPNKEMEPKDVKVEDVEFFGQKGNIKSSIVGPGQKLGKGK